MWSKKINNEWLDTLYSILIIGFRFKVYDWDNFYLRVKKGRVDYWLHVEWKVVKAIEQSVVKVEDWLQYVVESQRLIRSDLAEVVHIIDHLLLITLYPL